MSRTKVTIERIINWFDNQSKYTLKTTLKGDIKGRTKVLIYCNDCGHERDKVLSEILGNRYSCMGCLKIKQSKARKGVPVYSHEQYIEKLHQACPKITCISTYTMSNEVGSFVCFNCGATYKSKYVTALYDKKYLCNKCSYKNMGMNYKENNVCNFYDKYQGDRFCFDMKEVPYSIEESFSVVCSKCGSSIQRNRRQIVYGARCPVCETNASSGEKSIINILYKNGIKFIKEYYFVNPLLGNRGQRMDFYVNNLNLFIEFQGSQHYDKGNAWNTVYLGKRDRAKFAYAFQRGWELCYIYENKDIFIQLQEIFSAMGIILKNPESEYKVNYSIDDIINFSGRDGVHIDDVCNKYNIGQKTLFRYIKGKGYKNFKELQLRARWENIPDEDFLDYLSHNGLRRTASYYDKTVKTVTTHMNNLGYKKLYELQLERKTIIDAFDKKYILDLIVSEKGLLGASKKLGFPKYVLERYLPSLGYKNYQEVVKLYIKGIKKYEYI